ncbi:diacylglycerol/lipid kinase family protein [Methylobrevis pamukkalensis]|uniref:Diacylglycerol kinase n=1 Tax=Methylobrevis pamukkalensis TaxID=1439726 RepID=A0A1E3H4Z9_9HYPH|nr:diacylglycerol kinase family protein [Methylobrevis pamukkalensis]ODN71394.1 Diacylglycerol kinase [Methylobrevis pamukkalensis]
MTELPVAAALGRPETVAAQTREILIVANPTAGGFRARRLNRLAADLRAAGLGVEVRLTTRAGDLVEIARTLPPEIDTLVIGGGDGSINEAVNGLVSRPHRPPALAVLPFGTANVLARELNLPFRPGTIARMLIRRRLAPLHLGQIGLRAFLLMASAGFDGAVVHGVDPVLKRRIGPLAYALAAIRLALAGTGRDVIVNADGETSVCRIAVVTTARCYGGPMSITRHTSVTDPGLRLVTLADDRPMTLLKAAVMLGLGRLDRLKGVVDRAVARVRLSGEGILMQVDGDAIPVSEAPIEAHPRVLSVIVP